MAEKNADFLVDNGAYYDQIYFSTVANQVDYNGTSVADTLKDLSSDLAKHNHDGRYYTETEMNTKLAGKAEKNHTHPYLSTSGGTVDGDITVTGNVKMDTVSGNVKVNGNITMMKQGQMLCWSDENNKIQGRIYNNIITENNKKVQHFYILASNEANYALHLGVHDGMWTLDPDHGDDTNNQLALGAPSHRWGQFYTYVAVNTTSDRNEKENIEAIGAQYLDFFRGLKPVSYKLINGTSGRTIRDSLPRMWKKLCALPGLRIWILPDSARIRRQSRYRKQKRFLRQIRKAGRKFWKKCRTQRMSLWRTSMSIASAMKNSLH